MDDVVVNKVAIIERCVRRVREVYAGEPKNLSADITRQDSIVLNLQRACEAAIDLAMHLARVLKLGVPQQSRDAFDLLVTAGHLDAVLGARLKRMVGFRNLAVHDYVRLNLDIVRAIIDTELDRLLAFGSVALQSRTPPQR